MTGARAWVLVTDDDPVNRMLLSKLVEREGYRATLAEDGLEAWSILEKEPIDIVLLDVEMPRLDGFGVLERIESEPRLREIPVIMISALEDIDSVARCIELGADDYLPKPVNRTLLRARLHASLGRKRLHELERERVRTLFSAFVPEAIVDQVMADADDQHRLGGERRIATVMFNDLRGFTTWSEANSPDRVIKVLDRYWNTMTDVILDYGGTLVSFQGDGFMSVFGAPVEHKDHADLAVAAARAMAVEALAEFNEWLRAERLGVGFRMGIGLNTGPVASGTVGSERQLAFAAVGDTTNNAARIEQMTKGTGHMVFLAESTRALLKTDPGDLMHVGEVTPRGRQTPIGLWAITAADYDVDAT